MRNSTFLGLLGMLLLSCTRTPNLDRLKENYIIDDLGIYIEKPVLRDNDPDRYSSDNRAYKIRRTFIFDYYIINARDTLKITVPRMGDPEGDFQKEWNFVSKNSIHEDKIETISIAVLSGITNENQTTLKYEYQYNPDIGNSTFNSVSGVIENEMNTWMHPHRDKYFMILELNPFPFIQQPFKTGNSWKWTIRIGDHWKDVRWKEWTGSIRNEYQYEIIGREKLQTKIGEMSCWIIQSTATSSIGSTGLIAYYNEDNGFVKLDYINIDKSRLTLEISQIR